MWAEPASDPGRCRQQAIMGRGHWDAYTLRDIVFSYVVEALADPDVVIVIEETRDICDHEPPRAERMTRKPTG